MWDYEDGYTTNVTHWEEVNGWKVPSFVSVSLDAGLRPIEVERAVTSWVDIENAVLRIPKEQSSKNAGHWVVGLQERTAETLDRWLEQRETDPKHDDTDAVWLTRRGNTYGSSPLRQVLRHLCVKCFVASATRRRYLTRTAR